MVFGIAFEGCACRSAWQVGVAEWLSERGLRPAVVSGASSGALVAAAVAMGAEQVLRETWLDLTARHRPFELRALQRGAWPGRMSHILRAGLNGLLSGVPLSDVPRPIAIAVTVLAAAGPQRRLLTQKDPFPLVDAVLASCFIPGPYSRPVVLGGRLMVDGAWHQRVPVDALPGLGATHLLALTTNPDGRLIGGLLRQRALPWPAGVLVLAPTEPLAIRGFDFDLTKNEAAIRSGRRSAEVFARRNERWLGGA